MLEEIFVYIDETEYKGHWGVGALLSEAKLEDFIVEEALNDLRRDKDIDNPETLKQDTKTLQNGWFHGSTDSRNARSHFSRSIKKHVKGLFFYSYNRDDSKRNDSEKNYRLHTLLNLVGIFQGSFKIHLIFEERGGFSSAAAEKIVESLYTNLDYGAYDFPTIPSFYPSFTLSIESKRNPGLQVTDYLLWATNRSVLAEQRKYSDWLGIQERDSAKTDGENDAWGRRFIGEGTPNFEEISLDSVKAYPPQPNLETEHKWEIYELYIVAENFVHFFAKHGLPTHCEHFSEDISRTSLRLRTSKNLGLEDIRNVARLFLRLFDTHPLHGNYPRNSKGFERLLKTKRFLGLTLRNDYIHGMHTCMALTQWRRELKPEFLEKLFKGEAYP